jgi:hypothetical protein
MAISSPGSKPARSMARTSVSSAASLLVKAGHQPPSSATPCNVPASRISDPAARYTSAVQSIASVKLRAPGQTTRKSWMSTRPPACAPPPKICTCGNGNDPAWSPPRWRYSGTPAAPAAACALAIDTATMALAPRRIRPSVPSSAINRRSSAAWSAASWPVTASAIRPLTLATARLTSQPPKVSPPSRRSSASPLPVEAPAGAMARPTAPPASSISASTVGRPRLSHTRRPCT